MDTVMDRQTVGQSNRQTDGQSYRQTDKQMDKQTDKQKDFTYLSMATDGGEGIKAGRGLFITLVPKVLFLIPWLNNLY